MQKYLCSMLLPVLCKNGIVGKAVTTNATGLSFCHLVFVSAQLNTCRIELGLQRSTATVLQYSQTQGWHVYQNLDRPVQEK
jgi:hypothetical protein